MSMLMAFGPGSSPAGGKAAAPSSSAFPATAFGDATAPGQNDPLVAAFAELNPGAGSSYGGGAGAKTFHRTPVTVSEAPSGLKVHALFLRKQSLLDPTLQSIRLVFVNNTRSPIESITMLPYGTGTASRAADGAARNAKTFPPLRQIDDGATAEATLSVDFGDSTSAFAFAVEIDGKKHTLSFSPAPGELCKPVPLSEADFQREKQKLGGMMETATKFSLPSALSTAASGSEVPEVLQHILEAVADSANVALVGLGASAAAQRLSEPMASTLCFAGELLKNETKLLIWIELSKRTVHVYAEDTFVHGPVCDQLVALLRSAA
jgi:hypothetical protein